MPDLSEVNWVDDFVITVFFVAVEILSLPAVTFGKLVSISHAAKYYVTHPSSGRKENRLGEHLSPANALPGECFASSVDSLGFAGRL